MQHRVDDSLKQSHVRLFGQFAVGICSHMWLHLFLTWIHSQVPLGTLRLLGGIRRTPTSSHILSQTHTSFAGWVWNITSSSKPAPFLISAVQPPPLCYLSLSVFSCHPTNPSLLTPAQATPSQPPSPPFCFSLRPTSPVSHKLLAKLEPVIPQA